MNRADRYHEPEKLVSPAEQFDRIASLYDDLMAGVPYSEWVQYLHGLVSRHGGRLDNVLDLCCGTGTVSLRLAREGCSVTGVDISPEMIARATQRAAEERLSVRFVVQDAAKLRLGKKFDTAVSLFDSLNYILDSSVLQDAFRKTRSHLLPGGLFIFDMNTELALSDGLFTQNNLGSRSGVIYDWRSSYDSVARICRVEMTFWDRRGGSDERVCITHHQRAYGIEEIRAMLSGAGLDTLAVYNAYTFRAVSKRSDRAFFVAQRRSTI